MAINTQRFTLDISKQPSSMKVLRLAQGDHNGTTVRVEVTDAGKPLDLDGYEVYWTMLLPDGRAFYRNRGDAAGNVATVLIDERYAASVPGVTAVAYLEIRRGDELIASTERISARIAPSAEDGTERAGSWDSVVEAFIAELESFVPAYEAAESARQAAFDEAEAARREGEAARERGEAAREAAEGVRSDAEAGRAASEDAREESEGIRRSAEADRAAAEQERSAAESSREASEQARWEAESARSDAEALRTAAEASRASAESGRADAEGARAEAEGSRSQAESGRLAAEAARSEAESGRARSEDARARAEGSRNEGESARARAESGRASAEAARGSAESGRADAENARAKAESARAAEEARRVAEFAEMKQLSNGWTIYVCGEGEYDAGTRVPSVDSPDAGTLYMVPLENPTEVNRYEEWEWVAGAWERHGATVLTVEGMTPDRIDAALSGEAVTGNDFVNATSLSYLLGAMEMSDEQVDGLLESLFEQEGT